MEDVGKNIDKMLNRRNYRSQYSEMMDSVLKDPDVTAFLSEHKDKLTPEDIEKSYAKIYEFVQENENLKLTIPQ